METNLFALFRKLNGFNGRDTWHNVGRRNDVRNILFQAAEDDSSILHRIVLDVVILSNGAPLARIREHYII